MRIREAGADDVEGLARLLFLDTLDEIPTPQSLRNFEADLTAWWATHRDSHFAFVAELDDQQLVIGMAWLAIVPRIPRPGATRRVTADVQTVYVVPEHRGRGVGSALVEAATSRAAKAEALHVTVHSGRRAVPMYERLGFSSTRQLLQKESAST